MKLEEFKEHMTKINELTSNNPEVQKVLNTLENDYATVLTEKNTAIEEKDKAVKEKEEYENINKELWKASHTTMVNTTTNKVPIEDTQDNEKRICIADLDLD